MRVFLDGVRQRAVEGRIREIDHQALRVRTGLGADDDAGGGAQLGHIGLCEIPENVHFAGLDQLLAHLAAGRNPHDYPIKAGPARLPIVSVRNQRDVVARDPLQHGERTSPNEFPVIRPAWHLRRVPRGVFGHDCGESAQEWCIKRLVPDDGGGRARTVDSIDFPVPGRTHGPTLRVDDRLPGEAHIFTGDRLSIRPLQARLEVVGNRPPVGRDPAVLPGGHFCGQARRILAFRAPA